MRRRTEKYLKIIDEYSSFNTRLREEANSINTKSTETKESFNTRLREEANIDRAL